jgi:hypothetical protein
LSKLLLIGGDLFEKRNKIYKSQSKWITCLKPRNLLHKYLQMDNSNGPCGLFIVLFDDLWLTGAFLAFFLTLCGVAAGSPVLFRQFCWVGRLLMGACVVLSVLLVESGRWAEQ